MKDKIVSICPNTGLKLTTYMDWINVAFSPDYNVTYKIIEKNILVCETMGSADLENLKKALHFSLKIIKENFEDEPFIYMEDFSKVMSPSTEGRKYYIEFMKGLKNMKALIYYKVNPFLSLSIKLAQKLNLFTFDVFVKKNYPDAIELSINILNNENKKRIINKKEYEIKVNPDWKISFSDFSVNFEIINENIFHVNSEGILKPEYLKSISKMEEKIIRENLSDKLGKYYYVINLNKVEITRECRKLFSKKMQKLYNQLPFKFFIYYGANRLINIAVIFGVSLINYHIKKEKNFETVLEFIKKRKKNITRDYNILKIRKKKVSLEIQKYIDEFLVFLSRINWESSEIKKKMEKDLSHPFHQVYDAITLIKSDLDELYLERKKNEEEKAILQYKLQQSLKLEAMGKLAGSVAHDLNNVLSGIVSYPDIILKELPVNKENEKAKKYVKRMKKSGQKAADIVQDLLTLSRSGAVSFEPININSIIKDYLNSLELKSLMETKPFISIESRLEEGLQNISGSSIHISKTIMNLVTNAIEAISDKGVVKIVTNNKHFNNKMFKNYDKKIDGEFIELSISDTGTGISKQDLPKIFEPFYSKKVMGRSGTGLGMVVVKGTIDDHNGYIIINSEEGKGSEFLLYFPVNTDKSNKKFIQKIDNFTGKGESILVVDDGEDQRIIAYKILKGLHYSVQTVSSGEKAIEHLKENKVDLILLDMIMEPGIGGLETFKQIKKLNPNQKAIIVSGYSVTNHVSEAQKLGAGKYIRKPYTIEEIGIAVYKELKKN